jgi:hypothetical protein
VPRTLACSVSSDLLIHACLERAHLKDTRLSGEVAVAPAPVFPAACHEADAGKTEADQRESARLGNFRHEDEAFAFRLERPCSQWPSAHALG